MRMSALFALLTFVACKSGPVDPTETDADTDTDSDTDADADCPTADADLGHALGGALATGTTCGAGDEFTPTCASGEERSYSWTAPYAGDFVFTVGSGASVSINKPCGPSTRELSCGTQTTSAILNSQEQVVITVDGDTCGDYELGIHGTQDFAVADAGGVVLDQAGTPVAGVQIRFCATVCLNAETDANGTWQVLGAERTNTSLEAIRTTGNTAVAFAAVQIGATEDPSYTMTVLPLGVESPLTANVEWHDLTDGLRVQVSGPEVETPTFFEDPTGVAGVLVPEAQWPPLHGLSDVVAVWYTAPFDYTIPTGAPIEIDNDWNLPDGGVYKVWVGDYTSRNWIDVGTLTAGATVLSGAAEIEHFSTIVLTGPIAP